MNNRNKKQKRYLIAIASFVVGMVLAFALINLIFN